MTRKIPFAREIRDQTLLQASTMAFALLLLIRYAVERIEPGYGTAVAVAVGAGTLILPFATLFFSHVLSAMLAFAAFAVLWRERAGPERSGGRNQRRER